MGCGGAVVFAAGFREGARLSAPSPAVSSGVATLAPPAGATLEAELRAAALRHAFPVCGPNCDGLVALHSRAALWGDALRAVEPGHVGLVSQSGNLVVNALATRRGLRLHTAISSGNETVVTTADWLAQLATEPEVRSVALLVEDAGDGAALCEALAACADAGIGVAVLKVGASAVGAAAAAAHTGALAGDQRVFRALVREAGAAWADDVHDLLELAKALAVRGARPRGRGLGILTCSGGDSGLGADEAERLGIELPAFAPATSRRARGAAARHRHDRQPARLHRGHLGRPRLGARRRRARRRGPERRPGARLLRPPARPRRRAGRELAGGRGRHRRRRPREPGPGHGRRHPSGAPRRRCRRPLRRRRRPRGRRPPHRPRLRRRPPDPAARPRPPERDGLSGPRLRRIPFARPQRTPSGRPLARRARGQRPPPRGRGPGGGGARGGGGGGRGRRARGPRRPRRRQGLASRAPAQGRRRRRADQPGRGARRPRRVPRLQPARRGARGADGEARRRADRLRALGCGRARARDRPRRRRSPSCSTTSRSSRSPPTPERVERAIRRLKGAALLARADLPAAARLATGLTHLTGLELVECNPVLVHHEGAVVVDAIAKEISP